MSNPLDPPQDAPSSQRGEKKTSSLSRSDSFRAIMELLGWAYGYRPRVAEVASTQRASEIEEHTTDPVFDASVWGETFDAPASTSARRLGRFEIGRELGRGGFGVVHLAFDMRLGRKVALKLPRPDRAQNPAVWSRFAHEARLAASLDHEAIVPVLDAGLIDETFYLATAYQKGVPLSRWLMRYPGGIPARAAATLMVGLASGIAYAHSRGVLHRDLKPGNVLMVTPDDPGGSQLGDALPQPRITDFGLGTLRGENEQERDSGSWNGTPPYIAPEQILLNRGPVDARADIYALGAILYEMLTSCPIYPCRTIKDLVVLLEQGEPPIPPRQIRRSIPRDLETICLKCLEHDPDRRYASASALMDDLSKYLRGQPVEARPRPAWARLGRWARRNPSLAALVGVGLSASLFIAGLIAGHEAKLSATNRQLQATNRYLESIVSELRTTMENLRSTDRARRKATYAADLHLAAQEIDSGRIEVGQAILLHQKPEAGHEDLREFSWNLLWRRATRSHGVSSLKDLSWWKGAMPRLSADRSAHLFDGRALLRPLGVRIEERHETIRLDRDYRRVFDVDHQKQQLDSLWYDDGKNRVPLPIKKGYPRLGPDGSTLAVSDPAWVVPLGQAPAPRVRSLAWTEAERALQPGLPNGELRVVEVPSAFGMTFSEDGRTLGLLAHVPGQTTTVPLIYDLESGRGRSLIGLTSESQIGTNLPSDASPRSRGLKATLVLSPDGQLAALSGWERRISVFETQTGRLRWALDRQSLGDPALVTSLAFSPDGKILVSGDTSGNVRVWDTDSGTERGQFPVKLKYILAVGWYPDSRTVAIIVGGEDLIRFWRYAPDPPEPDRMDHGDEVWDLAYVAHGTILASAGDDDRIHLWDPVTCKPLKTFAKRKSLVTTLAVGGDDERIYSGDFSGQVAETTVGENGHFAEGPIEPPLYGGSPIRALARSPDGNYLVAAGKSSQIWIRQIDDRFDRLFTTTHHGEIRAVAFSRDGKSLALGCDDRSVTIWGFPEMTLRSTIQTPGMVTCLAFTADPHFFVSGDEDGKLEFWNIATATPSAISQRATESGSVLDLAFSPDGRTLASSGEDGAVRLWDPETAHELLKLEGHTEKVHAITFSPDGQTLASADFTGKILLHRTQPVGNHPE